MNGFQVKFDVKESFHRLFILLMELVWWALYFKKYFSIGIFVAVCLFTEKIKKTQHSNIESQYW